MFLGFIVKAWHYTTLIWFWSNFATPDDSSKMSSIIRSPFLMFWSKLFAPFPYVAPWADYPFTALWELSTSRDKTTSSRNLSRVKISASFASSRATIASFSATTTASSLSSRPMVRSLWGTGLTPGFPTPKFSKVWRQFPVSSPFSAKARLVKIQ